MEDTTNCEKTTQTQNTTPSRRNFIRKAGAAAFVAPVVASYLVSDLVKSAKAQEEYGTKDEEPEEPEDSEISMLNNTFVTPTYRQVPGHEEFSFKVKGKTKLTINVLALQSEGLERIGLKAPSSAWFYRSASGTGATIEKSVSEKGTYYIDVEYMGVGGLYVEVNAEGADMLEDLKSLGGGYV
ncbi:hypothetical protein [Dethiosulfatarculus sandiegensis]|uniref:Uncharacterized protein n=1 Tax=Dethiosulfatarculus sandiegensis TaxID=1429043 RepID=A0A0D2HM33_9BACT|nr:hypothetical protein [Dethiosulfatarculus sandiegensis]KIX11673.1 hypothetical protein X474_23105 [Dethiosulfatarculus sandiegensis]